MCAVYFQVSRNFMHFIIVIVAVASLSVRTVSYSCVGWLCVLSGAGHVYVVPTAALLVAPQNMPDIP